MIRSSSPRTKTRIRRDAHLRRLGSHRLAIGLLELVLVFAALALIAALAVPRFSRGAETTPVPELRERLSLLRSAIELYYYDHGAYPGAREDGRYPPGSPEAFVRQLTRYTDEAGRVSETRDAQFRFGPYLRAGIPPCPVAPRNGCTGVVLVDERPRFRPEAVEAGWVFNWRTGDLAANSNLRDPDGMRYDDY